MRKGNRLLILLFLLLFVGGLCLGLVVGKHLKNKKKDPVDEPNVVDISGISDFNLQMFKLENNKKNMVYSPLSMKYALKLLDEGASNNTKTEIEKVVGIKELIAYPPAQRARWLQPPVSLQSQRSAVAPDCGRQV